jgi:riboflavin-specific deaminase-like protein
MLWPNDGEIDDTELRRLYDYPPEPDRPWVQVNFVSSLDGSVSVAGKSHGLSGPADKKVFALGRTLADVVLVAAGTAIAEGYHGVRAVEGEGRAELRRALGLAPLPPIAVVTRSCSVPVDSPLLTDAEVPTIVLTTSSAPAERRNALADAGADVVVTGADDVHLPTAMRALDERGLRRVTCEGGPRLFGAMIAADLVDQLCLTVSPLLAGGDGGRIAVGPFPSAPRDMALASVLRDDDFLMLRYRRKTVG